MTIDDLSVEEQETTTYCHSCGEVRNEDELGGCLICGARICGLQGCSSLCFCDDARKELGLSVSGDVLSPAYPDAYVSAVSSILLDIDGLLPRFSNTPA